MALLGQNNCSLLWSFWQSADLRREVRQSQCFATLDEHPAYRDWVRQHPLSAQALN